MRAIRKTALVGALLAAAAVLMPAAAAQATTAPPLTFGIYPGGYAGGGSTDTKPDDPAKIIQALNGLQGGQRQFLVREYVGCTGTSLGDVAPYLGHGRRLDLVLDFDPAKDTPQEWVQCVRDHVRTWGPLISTLSVTLEGNLAADQDAAAVRAALVHGVIAAKQQADTLGYRWLQVGFDEVAFGSPDTDFWQSLNTLGGKAFTDSVDYVGVDLYLDVPFPGVPSGSPIDLKAAVPAVLKVVRDQEMSIAGLGRSVPIRVSENGWPTSATRSEAQQAQALATMITAVDADRATDNVVSYEMFALRDDVTGSTNIFDQFGITHDDYTPKPAFDTYRGLIAHLG